MTIAQAEIKTYNAKANGRINDASLVTSGVTHNVFNKILPAHRTSGLDEKVKLYDRFEDADDGQAQSVLAFLGAPTTDAIEFYLQKGTHLDTPASPTSTDYYGVGSLDANISSSATEIDVLVKDGAVIQFRDGDTIVFLDHTVVDPDDQIIETAVISGTPSIASDVVTITLTAGVANSMTAADVYVASAASYGTVEGDLVGSASVTSASGTFDDAEVTVPNTGGVYQTWTLTFTSATAYSLSGDDLGSGLATGNVSTIFAPTNPNTGTAYFSIAVAAWGGTYAAADTVEFTTTPAGIAYHVRRLVPAGSAASSAQQGDLRTYLQA